ncbi:hypothetical protein C8Q73DRAFT_304830 [Cubamyces lactineus]|nr:hypothetical protein C8Q73DRAFT_304830 [Cubamyces lactineus]
MVRTLVDWRRALTFAALYAGVLSSDHLVDDTDPKIIYSPSNGWSQDTTCMTCDTYPSSSKAQNGTWHNINTSTEVEDPKASFTFTGTGVRVYAILPAYSASEDPNVPIIHTDTTFFLDNIVQGLSYEYYPPVGADYQYHHLIFNSSNLAYGEHTLMILPSWDDVTVLLLDYIVYTVPDSMTSSPTQSTLTSGNSTRISGLDTAKTPQPQSSTLTTSATTHASSGAPVSASIKPSGSSKSSAPTTPVVVGAVAGSLVFLICLLAAVVYLLCMRSARKRLVTVASHTTIPQDDGRQRLAESHPELYPVLASATKPHLPEDMCDPFSSPETRHSMHDYASAVEPSFPLPTSITDLAATPAPPDDSELLSPRQSTQTMATARASRVASLSSPSSQPAMLIDNGHIEAAIDKVPTASGSESYHGIAPPAAPASTRFDSDEDAHPIPTSIANVSAPSAYVRHPSFASDASLREQLAALRNEVARIRARQEALPGEAPPPYDEMR